MPELHVGRAEIAHRLNLSERQITNLVRDGRLSDGTRFPSRTKGRIRTFPSDRCFEWYIRWKQEEAIDRAATRPAPTNMLDAELRKAVADAEMAELKLAKLRGEVAPIEQHRKEMRRVLGRVRARFQAIPGEFAPRILEPMDMARATRALRDLVSTVLADLQSAAAGPSDVGEDDEEEEDVA